MTAPFFNIQLGQIVIFDNRSYEITHVLSSNAVLGKDIETGESVQLRVEGLKQFQENIEGASEQSQRDLFEYSEQEWAVANKRMATIEPLLKDHSPTRTLAETLAEKSGVSVATVYRWRDQFI